MDKFRFSTYRYYDFKPFLKSIEEYANFKYHKVIADTDYESEENYVFLENNNQLSFIKPSNYEVSKTRKYKNDIGRVDSMNYNSEDDHYICKNNKNLYASNNLLILI
ncbi:TPA: hypothetical protein KQG29_002727 [Clostridioides difficile]|nr:hypothetical protein [Clostridioides difficile]